MSSFQKCEFLAGVNNHDALPQFSLPEVAFAGRSNVGKSSLINALTGRKALARTSQTPGRTRQLNFFAIEEKFILVDLPGYGYAKASKTDIRNWTGLTKDYLCGRPTLRRVFLLMDARRAEITQDDRDWMSMFDDAAVTFQIIITKADKASQLELETKITNLQDELRHHPAGLPAIITTSAEKHIGIKELRNICMML
jgi:GTP-binding protein